VENRAGKHEYKAKPKLKVEKKRFDAVLDRMLRSKPVPTDRIKSTRSTSSGITKGGANGR
jgi:hypothetical protein